MTTTLSEGVKVPDVGSVNWAGDLEVNWNLLNGALANLSGNVKLDRDNTWTGEQSFTLPIVGSITGTASKAIADEDGTSIKTGYVNVAGNQTVSGQKTFSANIHFTSGLYQRNTTYEIGTTPASNINITQFLADKDSKYTGCLRNAISTTGLTSVELEARNKVGSGALSPTGNATSSTFKVEVQPDGTKTLYFDGSIRNNVLPYTTNTYSLGSSSYQWSSVYAQTYYYNGTAWGLDKANTWTNVNTFSMATSESIAVKHVTYKGAILFRTNGVSNFKNYNTFLKWDINGYDNSLGLYRSIGVFGDTTTGATDEDIDTSFSLWKAHIRSKSLDFTNSVKATNDGTENSLKPITTGVTDLGTSTNKWKSLNGINPGALSLPDASNAVSIDTTDWDKTGNLISYTPPVDGWISIITDNSSAANYIRCAYDNGDILAKANGNGYAQGLSVFLPVPKNVQVGIRLVCTTISTAKLYPMLGNV